MTDSLDPRLEPHYATLGLTPPASPDQIRDAYRGLVQQLHPDKLPENTPTYLRTMAEEEFLRVQEAYYALRSVPTALVPPVPRSGDPIQPRWPGLIAAALGGSALTFGLMAGINLARGPQASVAEIEETPAPNSPTGSEAQEESITQISTAPDSESSSDPTPAENVSSTSVASTEPLGDSEVTALTIEQALQIQTTSQPQAPEGSPEFVPTSDQIERFVITLREVQPILQATHSRMDQATTPEERQQIEESFETAARKMIIANGLTPSEYQQISWAARQNPEIAARIQQVGQADQPAIPPSQQGGSAPTSPASSQ